ncbi:MAG: uncharacterized protein JWM93_1066 [Frankiales bacterium]|nr:uncharacterized protein [Frankiales bacterium]
MTSTGTRNDQDFSAAFVLDATPDEALAAVTDVRGWWSGTIEGQTTTLGDVFTYEVPDVHKCRMTLTELVPGRRVVWHVTDSWIGFVDGDTAEWDGTDMVFDITETTGGTEVRFTHVGLAPRVECFDMCSSAWSTYVASLRDLIVTGEGDPIRPHDRIDPEWVKLEHHRLRSARAANEDEGTGR